MATVQLFHAVDTEGPLYESPRETVARINRATGLSLPVEESTLVRIQKNEIDSGHQASAVKTLLKYSIFLPSWTEVKTMLNTVMSDAFRLENCDSEGRGWAYNWHIMDHVGYDLNPRHRDIGFHNIFDVYTELLKFQGGRDELGFHFHPSHFFKWSNYCGETYSTSKYLYEMLARKLIDRDWFPRSFRAGFHTERPDSNLFLEQWIPHDFSSQSIERPADEHKLVDLAYHRLGDWTRAPRQWGWYHPHHDDYQTPGNCRRRIYRCLNIGTRLRCITEEEIKKAFTQVKETGQSVLVGVTNHDYRDMSEDVRWLKAKFDFFSQEFDIPWQSTTIAETFPSPIDKTRSKYELRSKGSLKELFIEYDRPIFGPQPFLAIKLINEFYHHINFDIIEPFRRFSYTFDENTVSWNRIEKLVVGTNDRMGNIVIDRIKDQNNA